MQCRNLRKLILLKGIHLFCAASVLSLVCIPGLSQNRQKKEAPRPVGVRVTAEVPSLSPLEESEQSQVKGGIRITMQPEPFKTVESIRTVQREVPPPSKWGFTVSPGQGSIYVERSRVPELKVSPERLILRLNLNNQLPRVFRGSGIAVQFNVAGKVVPVNAAGYGDLVNIVLPPRGEQEVTIVGPSLDTIPAPSTIGIFLFDVVTGIDQAGNVTDKQNFEWYFSYQKQAAEKVIMVPPPESMWTQR